MISRLVYCCDECPTDKLIDLRVWNFKERYADMRKLTTGNYRTTRLGAMIPDQTTQPHSPLVAGSGRRGIGRNRSPHCQVCHLWTHCDCILKILQRSALYLKIYFINFQNCLIDTHIGNIIPPWIPFSPKHGNNKLTSCSLKWRILLDV